MNIRCTYCQHTFNLPRDYIAQAVTEAEEKRQKYYGVECINCRKLIKVPLAQMKRLCPVNKKKQKRARTTRKGRLTIEPVAVDIRSHGRRRQVV